MWYLAFMFCMASADQCAMPNDKIPFQVRVYQDAFHTEAECEDKAKELMAHAKPQANITISHQCLNLDEEDKD